MADAQVMVTFNAMIKSFSEGMAQAVAPLKELGKTMSHLTAPEPIQSHYISMETVAQAFDVPLELISPPGCVNHSPQASGQGVLGANAMIHHQAHANQAQEMAVQALKFQPASMTVPLGQINPELYELLVGEPHPNPSPVKAVAVDLSVHGEAFVSAHEDGSITVHDPKKMTLSNHSWGTAVDVNIIPPQDHMHFEVAAPKEPDWEPTPEQLDGDGDPFVHQVKPTFLDTGKLDLGMVHDSSLSVADLYEYASLPPISTVANGPKYTVPPQPWKTDAVDPDAPYGWWCCYHEEHFESAEHLAGDPVECDHYAQPATSYQHKMMLVRR